jgi:tetrahydromethanopterin S-methyltransferase subunit B
MSDELRERLARLEQKVVDLEKSIDRRIKEILEQLKSYVSIHEFRPVRLVVYGAVASILAAFIAAVIQLAK